MGEVDGQDGHSGSGIIWRDELFNPIVRRQFLNWYITVAAMVVWVGIDIVLSVGREDDPRGYIYVFLGLFAVLTGLALSIIVLSARESHEPPPPGYSVSGRTAGLLMGSAYFLISAVSLVVTCAVLIRG
jgi:hypothetical protein